MPAMDLRRFGFQVQDPEEMVTLYRGKGCEACRETGYKGRIGFHELMVMNAEMHRGETAASAPPAIITSASPRCR